MDDFLSIFKVTGRVSRLQTVVTPMECGAMSGLGAQQDPMAPGCGEPNTQMAFPMEETLAP